MAQLSETPIPDSTHRLVTSIVQYFVPVPSGSALVVLTLGTPVPGMADTLTTLFDCPSRPVSSSSGSQGPPLGPRQATPRISDLADADAPVLPYVIGIRAQLLHEGGRRMPTVVRQSGVAEDA